MIKFVKSAQCVFSVQNNGKGLAKAKKPSTKVPIYIQKFNLAHLPRFRQFYVIGNAFIHCLVNFIQIFF
jgi:hypothetical protein